MSRFGRRVVLDARPTPPRSAAPALRKTFRRRSVSEVIPVVSPLLGAAAALTPTAFRPIRRIWSLHSSAPVSTVHPWIWAEVPKTLWLINCTYFAKGMTAVTPSRNGTPIARGIMTPDWQNLRRNSLDLEPCPDRAPWQFSFPFHERRSARRDEPRDMALVELLGANARSAHVTQAPPRRSMEQFSAECVRSTLRAAIR